jgi:hypothetical protein
MRFSRVLTRILPATLALLPLLSCSGSPSDSPVLTADVPLHLEEHLDAATLEGSEVPADVPQAIEWRFDEPQPEWKPAMPWNPTLGPAEISRADDALRVTLTEATRDTSRRNDVVGAGIYVEVPDWQPEDWAYVPGKRLRRSDSGSTSKRGQVRPPTIDFLSASSVSSSTCSTTARCKPICCAPTG